MKTVFVVLINLSVASVLAAQLSNAQTNLDPYLDTVIDLLEENSLLAKQVNWKEVRTSVAEAYPIIEHDSTRYAAVRRIIGKYRLKHHSFMSPAQAQSWRHYSEVSNSTSTCSSGSLEMPTSRLIEHQIGYLKVPMFSTADSLKLNEYATSLQRQIKVLHDQGVNQWIVDLRGNMGGHMWPMIVGLGPLLGEEKMGSFVRQEEKSHWYYKDGKGMIEGQDSVSTFVNIEPALPPLAGQKIAVLIDSTTMSSGEAVTIAFLGKENVRTFGQKTGGYSTGNANFDLEDGAILFITTSVYADRQSTLYYDGIAPEQFVGEGNDTLASAIDWLKSLQ